MLFLIQFLLLATVHLSSAASTTKGKVTCSTKPITTSGAKNTTSTSTYTTYKTTKSSAYTTYPQYTVTNYDTYVVKTVTSTTYYTSYTTKASATKTVPTPSGFVPFTSVNASIRPVPPTTYAWKTVCTTTVTSGTTTVTFDSWRPDYTTWVKTVTWTDTVTRSATKNVTIATPTATVYAACNDKNGANVGKQWKGKNVNAVTYESLYMEDFDKPPPYAVTRAAGQSAVNCCNSAFAVHELALNDTSDQDVAGFLYIGPTDYSRAECRFFSARNYKGDYAGVSFWTGDDKYPVFANLGLVLDVLPNKKPAWVYEGFCSPSDVCYVPVDD